MIDGITFRKRTPKTPFEIYEIYYQSNFLAYIWRPKGHKGPAGQSFVVAPENMSQTLDHQATGDPTLSWDWFYTLDEATDFLFQREFTKKL